MRKHVKPAHSRAAIPDPVRGGDLPSEGLTVEWSVHWARLAQRGDIIVKDVAEALEPTKVEKRAVKASPARATRTKRAPRQASTKANPPGAKTDVPEVVPEGDAPDETGPQLETADLDAPAAPAAPEPSIT